MQEKALRSYAHLKGWKLALVMHDISAGSQKREAVLDAARAREIDVILVWRIEVWGSSLTDLVITLEDLTKHGVRFVSVAEAFDVKTKVGGVVLGILSKFSSLDKEMRGQRIKIGIAQAKAKGILHGRPRTASLHKKRVHSLYAQGMTKASIARKLKIGRTSVVRILAE
jgi:DNA invertase Pin-like site-specific DNA recombinase